MSTNVSADYFLKCLDRWGVKWRFYSTKTDWLRHNRNKAGNNINAPETEGTGFGPLRGVAIHNTASTSQTGMLTYLYNGDSARALPGPLCNWAVLKTGDVVLMGWGTSNATGPGDPRPDALVRKNAMPMDSEIRPTTSGPSDPDAILYAPYYPGMEACYASEGPTAAQRDAMVRATCAMLDAMGGPADGYGAGSVVMHRELTTTRSDPQGWAPGEFRRAVAARFKAGPPKPTTTPEVPVAQKPVTSTLSVDRPAVTQGESLTLSASVSPAIPGFFYFDYLDSATNEWKRWYTQDSTTGKATTTNRPSRNVSYRVGFAPKDSTTYAKAPWASTTVVVVDLVRLLTEHRQALTEIADLKAEVAALQGVQPAADITPGG